MRALSLLVLFAALSLALDARAESADDVSVNVSIPVFDTGLGESTSTYAELGVFPRIREIESRYLPFALRRKLTDSGDWGAVRVVPENDVIEELVIHGEIVRSDSETLSLGIKALDASGAAWIDDVFSVPLSPGMTEPGYDRIFSEVATRLGDARRAQTARQLSNNKELALLRYGARLAPGTFGQYITETGNDRYEIRRLPARGDPMIDRIARVREAEYVIVDAADERYSSLHEEVDSVYDKWREYSWKSMEYEAEDERRIAEVAPPGPKGSFDALVHVYDNYKFSRITAEERADMAVAFDNEVRPELARLEERLDTFDFWVEQKYIEWNSLIEELNELETRYTD